MIYISFILLLGNTNQAEEFYKQGLYEKALEEYNQFINEGISNPNLYLNIGNCYYRMGEYGKALLNYRRAWFLAPGDPNIRHNISLFATHKKNPNPFISSLAFVVDRISLRTFAYLLIFSFTLLVILLSIRLIQLVRTLRFPTNPLLILSGVIFIFSLIGFSVWFGRVQSGWVVVTQSTTAYSGPGDQFKELMRIDEAEEGSVIRESNGWWLIQLYSGEGGWVDDTKAEYVLK